MTDVVIIDAVRTPIGRRNGGLTRLDGAIEENLVVGETAAVAIGFIRRGCEISAGCDGIVGAVPDAEGDDVDSLIHDSHNRAGCSSATWKKRTCVASRA